MVAATPHPPSPEGELRLQLTRAAGRVVGCRVESSRPDVALRLLQGRAAETIAAAVPRLFAICRDSQAVASQLALHAAGGAPPDTMQLQRCSDQVRAECLRETTLRVLLDWPRHLGESAGAAAVAAARAVRDGAASTSSGNDHIAQALFGEALSQWLARDTPAAWWQWAEAGATPAARFVLPYRDDPAQPAGAVLPAVLTEPSLRQLAADSDTPGFAAAPSWRGQSAETGALARLAADPLVVALRSHGWIAAARQAARLRELATLLLQAAGGTAASAVGAGGAGALELGPGWGLGWAHNARGLLLHVARLQGDRAASYRIVAPTEWNFHAQGALPAALIGSPAGDAVALAQRALRLVDSLDPCVACRIEVADA